MRFYFLLLFLPVFLYGQSEFINTDQSGFGINYDYSMNKYNSSIGGSAGISILGKVDLGVQYSSNDFQFENRGGEINSSTILGFLGFNIKTKNDKNNLKFMVGYISNRVNGGRPTDGSSGVLFGIQLSAKVFEDKSVVIMPLVGLNYGILSSTKENYIYFGNNFYLNTEEITTDTRSISFGFHFISKATEVVKFTFHIFTNRKCLLI